MILVPKLLYSLILLLLAGIFFLELWTVWFDKRVYIGKFEVVSETGADEAVSAQFAKRVVAAHTIQVQQFKHYQKARSADAPSDSTFVLPGMVNLRLPQELLSGVDLTVQNVNIRQLLTVMRRAFLAPNEVTGNVAVRGSYVLAAVDWPRAPRLNTAPDLTKFLVPTQPNSEAAASYIACWVSWAQAAASADLKYPMLQLCDFSVALGDLYALSEKASTRTGLDAGEAEVVRRRVAQLKTHYSSQALLPEVYRLRADLLDLLPEKDRKLAEVAEAQEDRLRYSMLQPEIQKLPAEERSYAALARARPAIVMDPGPKDVPENWARVLEPYQEALTSAADSVGLVTVGGQPCGTAFVVAPGVIASAGYVLDLARRMSKGPDGSTPVMLCFKGRDCSEGLQIGTGTIFSQLGSNFVLAPVSGHDPAIHPPIELGPSVDFARYINQYAAFIGFPSHDARMPGEFMKHLLGNQGTVPVKRLLPGRVLAAGPGGPFGVEANDKILFTTDISTSGGTGGAPLIDLATGRVIGISSRGIWKGSRGKFSYADPTPKAALDVIQRRKSGGSSDPAITSAGASSALQ
ncbi:hypothetical protein PMI14_06780 [Acidovorax sp. CF316]|uniref:trypsin-like peptidase domain-containing protein n=1 Tax=Acidovorax sp. CF316 TaxID=1144317 RepID=UPI00026BE2ED|nr:trypsin-like peptidase domain-containing protein [Acidovorax sp. CF316]EJE48779.1 hypothetical protein PMI14_06780 [Acidovorax sp. CF316]